MTDGSEWPEDNTRVKYISNECRIICANAPNYVLKESGLKFKEVLIKGILAEPLWIPQKAKGVDSDSDGLSFRQNIVCLWCKGFGTMAETM